MVCLSVDAPSMSRNEEMLMRWCVFQASHIHTRTYRQLEDAHYSLLTGSDWLRFRGLRIMQRIGFVNE